jgi:hypothetical protein
MFFVEMAHWCYIACFNGMGNLLRVCPNVGIRRSPWCESFAGEGGESDPSLQTLSLPTERSHSRLSVVLEFRCWW